jgi:hypothetical protein
VQQLIPAFLSAGAACWHPDSRIREGPTPLQTAAIISKCWKEKGLGLRRKGDPAKPAIAERLKKETTLPIKDIAAPVQTGGSRSANARPHRNITISLTGARGAFASRPGRGRCQLE